MEASGMDQMQQANLTYEAAMEAMKKFVETQVHAAASRALADGRRSVSVLDVEATLPITQNGFAYSTYSAYPAYSANMNPNTVSKR
jgi:hypothetical protein